MAIDEENYVVKENIRVTPLFLFADWPEKRFSGQSEAGNSNASGTGSVGSAKSITLSRTLKRACLYGLG